MAYRALDVANYVVHHALETGKPITHLQLQKILYYLEAHSLKEHGTSLFDDDIEKWKLGPVVPAVYHQYKIFGPEPIDVIPNEICIDEESFEIYFKEFNPDVIRSDTKKEITPIIDKLLDYTGPQLVNLTHKHYIWKKDEPKINSGEKGLKYDKEEMKEFFKITPPSELNIIYE